MTGISLGISAQNITYDIEPSVEKASRLHVEAWEKVERVNIFCIQLGSFSGESSGAKAQSIVNELNTQFRNRGINAQAYSVFDAPNHKVRVGNFSTKQEAYGMFHELQAQYPGAFITRDKRKVKEILK
jgi:cell division septation protein DedD